MMTNCSLIKYNSRIENSGIKIGNKVVHILSAHYWAVVLGYCVEHDGNRKHRAWTVGGRNLSSTAQSWTNATFLLP